jgi:hypothetical protein
MRTGPGAALPLGFQLRQMTAQIVFVRAVMVVIVILEPALAKNIVAVEGLRSSTGLLSVGPMQKICSLPWEYKSPEWCR